MKEINSAQNPTFKELRKRLRTKGVSPQGGFFIEGFRFVKEARRQGASFKTLVVNQPDLLDEVRDLEPEQSLVLPDHLFAKLSQTVSPQGILAEVKLPDQTMSFPEEGFFLYLDEIQDPGNLGTIIRSAHAFNLAGILLSKGSCNPYDGKVLRATMGSIFRVPLKLDQTPEDLMAYKERGFEIMASDLAASQTPESFPKSTKRILALGNEARGLSNEVLALAQSRVIIPMPGQAESLNVAVAASILMYLLH